MTRLLVRSFQASTRIAASFTTSTRVLPPAPSTSGVRCTTLNRASPAACGCVAGKGCEVAKTWRHHTHAQPPQRSRRCRCPSAAPCKRTVCCHAWCWHLTVRNHAELCRAQGTPTQHHAHAHARLHAQSPHLHLSPTPLRLQAPPAARQMPRP
jgi:hypothetical protein